MLFTDNKAHIMFRVFEKRLNQLVSTGLGPALRNGLRGLEKESLRVRPDGKIAQTPHPRALGSALTHPQITTDYSEALLEFVTPPVPALGETLGTLHDIHKFVYDNLDDELLWATSMPCIVDGDKSVPIARYGDSNIGRMKHIYRRGLDYRYGRTMQAIAGVHFNYSVPQGFWPLYQHLLGVDDSRFDFMADQYFALIRNFQRHSWLIPFFFGSSPAICRSFLGGDTDAFQAFDGHTLYEPYATSLRMSDIGYKNRAQAGVAISYNSLQEYVDDLTQAIETPDPEYAAIGTCVGGEWRQLNTNVLQIENEYYSSVRPKNVTRSGEKPTLALKRRGVQYVEIRALDLNPFEPTGVDARALRFTEALLLFCLLSDSPPIDPQEQGHISYNQGQVARCGRDPGLRLRWRDGSLRLHDWAAAIVDALQGVCEILDGDDPEKPYTAALKGQRSCLADFDELPSAQVLESMRGHGDSFVEFAMRLSERHAGYFSRLPLDPEVARHYRRLASQSLEEQAELEATDSMSFEEYLSRYFAQR